MFNIRRIVRAISRLPIIGKFLSRLAVNCATLATTPRPRPYSLWSEKPKPRNATGPVSDYTSWPALTDRRFSGRHLPPAAPEEIARLAVDAVYQGPNNCGDFTALFKRGSTVDSPRSTMLFPFFAQWFTDSFLRIDPDDRRKNTSNHEIDLCQIYGLDEATARILRSGASGKLRSQRIDSEEWPDFIYEVTADGSLSIKEIYRKLPYAIANSSGQPSRLDQILSEFAGKVTAGPSLDTRKKTLFATGLERGNSTIGYAAISTIFVREHNRLCETLVKHHSEWDDERLFQSARMINIALLLKVVIEDYINHISPLPIFRVDPAYPESQRWYRANWIALEFDLLYRWHSLIPDTFRLNGKQLLPDEFRTNNAPLLASGLTAVLRDASSQPAGRIGLFNTPAFLLGAEYQSLKMGRDFRLRGFNDYREQFGLDRFVDFTEFGDDATVQNKLNALYRDIDQVEFLVGLFAEQPKGEALLGELMTVMVASDAFSQALTNPLLSMNIFNERTFTKEGMAIIRDTGSLADIAARNGVDSARARVSFERE